MSMSAREKSSLPKIEDPQQNSDSMSMFSEQIKQIVEKMNDLATEQYSVTKKFTLIETELEKVQKDRSEAAKQNNSTLSELAEALKNLRAEVNKHQQEQIKILKTELEKMNKEHGQQVARTQALRQDLLEYVQNFKQENKPTLKERLMEVGLKIAVIVGLTSAVWVTLTLLLP